ncbi:transcriptional coactivator p15/PC4 family protein [bacterium]|nr:transcriptional coactivator p15/PC4 family protein [bacterium]
MSENHDIVIGKIQKNAMEEIHVMARKYKGYRFIDLRIHTKGNNDDFVPTPKGLTVKPEDTEALIELIKRAKKEMKNLEDQNS